MSARSVRQLLEIRVLFHLWRVPSEEFRRAEDFTRWSTAEMSVMWKMASVRRLNGGDSMKWFFSGWRWQQWMMYFAASAVVIFWGSVLFGYQITLRTLVSIIVGVILGQLLVWLFHDGSTEVKE